MTTIIHQLTYWPVAQSLILNIYYLYIYTLCQTCRQLSSEGSLVLSVVSLDWEDKWCYKWGWDGMGVNVQYGHTVIILHCNLASIIALLTYNKNRHKVSSALFQSMKVSCNFTGGPVLNHLMIWGEGRVTALQTTPSLWVLERSRSSASALSGWGKEGRREGRVQLLWWRPGPACRPEKETASYVV